MVLSGFLAPDGTFTECGYQEHTDTATGIVNRVFGEKINNGIRAEDFLYENSYVGFYARGASHRFSIGKGDERRVLLLTDAQKDFLINHLANANNDDQRNDMENLLRFDEDYREDSVLTRIENKFARL